MFENNDPVDKTSISYNVLWSVFKKLAAYRLEPRG
jgi:hypothetical protein